MWGNKLTRSILALAGLSLFLGVLCAQEAQRPVSKVYVIHITGMVQPGLAAQTERNIQAALDDGAAAIIFDIDTYGGLLMNAEGIKDAILRLPVPSVTYINRKAISAGAYIALAGEKLVVAPGSTIGAVTPIVPGEGTPPQVEQKYISVMQEQMRTVAQARKRNPEIAAAMVFADKAIDGLVQKGKVLTLNDKTALEYKMADYSASGYRQILEKQGLKGARIVELQSTFWDQMFQIVRMPWVTIFLLIVGLGLLIWELLTFHTFGIAGVIGGVMLAALFLAYLTYNPAAWFGLLIFIGGVLFLLFEAHVFPGHGLSAMIGLVGIFAGLYVVLGGTQEGAAITLGMSLCGTVVASVGFFMYLPKSRIWKLVGLEERQSVQAGYVSVADLSHLVGARGLAITQLRPAGMGMIDGQRVDVVTQGELIEKDTPIKVIQVEGRRVVVAVDG